MATRLLWKGIYNVWFWVTRVFDWLTFFVGSIGPLWQRNAWWRLRLIYTIWKRQLLWPNTGDHSLQSHDCYRPIMCTYSMHSYSSVQLKLRCIGGILYYVPGLFYEKERETRSVCFVCFLCMCVFMYGCVQGFTSTLCHSNLITLNLRCFSMPVNGTLHNILICSIVACSLMKEHHYTVHLFLSIHCYVQQTVHFCINAYFCAYYIAVLWNISSVKHNPAYPCTLCVIC